MPMEQSNDQGKTRRTRTDRLSRSDRRHLQAADGWLTLGNWHEAHAELEEITPVNRAHPRVLEVRWQVYCCAEKWEACLDNAETIVRLRPRRAEGWVHLSVSLYRLGRTEEAFDRLSEVAVRFPKSRPVPYNLTCFAARLARLDEAETWFKRAMALDMKEVRQQAIDDPDLKLLWDGVRESGWKWAPPPPQPRRSPSIRRGSRT